MPRLFAGTRLILLALLLAPCAALTAKEAAKPEAKPAAEKAKESKKVRLAKITLSGDYPETPGGSGPFAELGNDLKKLLGRIEKAKGDDTIAGMVLSFEDVSMGRGKLNELRGALADFRKAGKRVVAEMESADTQSYLIACACDEIVMPESGVLMLPGLRAEPLFYKGMLSKIGVRADFIHIGEAKGFGEEYTRKQWSEPVKQNITALLDDLYQQMIETIALDRPMTEAQVGEAIDAALITAGDAKERGLIDRIAYPHELREALAQRYDADGAGDRLVYVENYGQKEVDTDFSGPTGIFKLMKLLAGGDTSDPKSKVKKIAVVYAVGPIVSGESEEDIFGGSTTLGSTTIVEALDKADKDDAVAAIVLRVDSPGGSALASDLMWSKIQSIDKPVVASMGDVAASGGYYISMGCDAVLAEPGTVTGSIGVVGGKLALGGLFKKVGITTDLISRGANSGLLAATRPWNESERAAITGMMEECYDQFTAKAAAGRKMKQARVKELGGGKVYTGRQAKKLGLVDKLGTLEDAVAEAKKRAGLAADAEVKIESLPEAPDFFEQLFSSAKPEKEVRLSIDLSFLPAELERAVRSVGSMRRVFEGKPAAFVMPVGVIVD
ncbi:Protease 4 [Pirellulimonas nuda]|uniref:Protease 4 n=1 Tax=Pirellulimonas nuda TaxID=2528009 RepID=A0A518D5K5_9BACT|nr:signal peptide peptidase SppA [Pirellulimonas nuda]QDU86757.1 Protease 4 [Pirellulimonas nuda]